MGKFQKEIRAGGAAEGFPNDATDNAEEYYDTNLLYMQCNRNQCNKKRVGIPKTHTKFSKGG